MEEQNKIPKLLEFLFGEAAEAARQGASQRLLAWCRAFDEWLAERLACSKSTHKQAGLAWKRLLRQRRKMPWEFRPADIQAHMAWMQAQGYAASTTANMVGILGNFYAWCGERRVDAECGPGFNPAAGVARPKVRRYDRAELLSRGEVQALLGILKRDVTPLGRREYAFFLARLRLGVPLRGLQRLQWGQIELERGQAWLRLRPEAERIPLPGEVWQAILDYLQASGRLVGMREASYVFAPLAEPGKEERSEAAQDWVEGRCLSNSQILANLKIYGRPAGIPEGKLTLQALRRTAVRLRLDEGEASTGDTGSGDGSGAAALEATKAFLDSREAPRLTKHRLKLLPQIPPEAERAGEEAGDEPPLPERKAKPFKLGEGIIHGLYAQSQPRQAVLEVLAENIQGVDAEFKKLRLLERGLVERMEGASDGDRARLIEASLNTAFRLEACIKAEKRQAVSGEEDSLAEEILAMEDRVQLDAGLPPVSDQIRKEALGGEPKLKLCTRSVCEEIAVIRLGLRSTFDAAMTAGSNDDYVRWVNLYCKGFKELLRAVKTEEDNQPQLMAYLLDDINRTIAQFTEERGLRG